MKKFFIYLLFEEPNIWTRHLQQLPSCAVSRRKLVKKCCYRITQHFCRSYIWLMAILIRMDWQTKQAKQRGVRNDRNKNINRKGTLIKIVTAVIITRTVMIDNGRHYRINGIIWSGINLLCVPQNGNGKTTYVVAGRYYWARAPGLATLASRTVRDDGTPSLRGRPATAVRRPPLVEFVGRLRMLRRV